MPGYTNPQNLNRYSYVLNNPIKLIDPTGHICVGESVECLGSDGNIGAGFTGGNPTKKINKNRGCGGPDKSCLGKTNQPEGLIRQEIDRRFDPFIGWLPGNFNYAASEYPTYDYYAEQAYEQAGYDLMAIASQNLDNPMTEGDWVHSDVDFDYIYSKGVRGKAPGHQFFLNYMGRDIKNPSNYEANYLNALIVTHPQQLRDAKNEYYKQLVSEHGSPEAAWEYLEMTIDVAGPDIID